VRFARHIAPLTLVVAMVGVCAGAGAGPAPADAALSAPPVVEPPEPSNAVEHAQLARSAATVRLAVQLASHLAARVGAAADKAEAKVQNAANRAALTRALNRYGGNDFALVVVNNRTGESYRFRPTSRYETASVVKIDILAAVLLAAQDAGRSLTATERSLASKMIRASDNAAASTLWWQVGGHDGMSRVNARLGLTQTQVGYGELWGTTTTTVTDQIRMVDIITGRRKSLSAPSVAYAVGLMTTVNADQDWGVSAAARPGERVALKNGWFTGPQSVKVWTINSVGRITDRNTDVTIAVMSQSNHSMADGVWLVETATKLTRQYLHW
jgi:beta-lactamase class A